MAHGLVKDFLGFVKKLRKAAEYITLADDVIYIISHIDADGIAAAGILCNLLYEIDKPFILKFVKQLRRDFLEQFVNEADPREVVFVDVGSGNIEQIASTLHRATRIYVIDHHMQQDIDINEIPVKLINLNPRAYGFNGGREISSAGVAYMLSRVFSGKKPHLITLSKYGIIGALGDNQDIGEKKSLIGLNKLILEDAEKTSIIKAKVDLLISGRESKPLYQALAETYNPVLPGITNSLEGALNFIQSIGLGLGRLDLENITLSDLSDDQKSLLLEKLIERIAITFGNKFSLDEIKDMLIGYVYIVQDAKKPELKDAREFSTLLNACGKLGKPHIALGLLLSNSDDFYNEALTLYKQYRYMISEALKKAKNTLRDIDSIKIVDGRDYLHEDLTSTVSSIMATTMINCEVLMVISKETEGALKLSLRKCKGAKIKDIRAVLIKTIKKIGRGEGGGHESAAGAYIPKDSLDIFLETFRETLAEETR